MTPSRRGLSALRTRFGRNFVPLLPFFGFCLLFELIPVASLLVGSVNGRTGLTLEYLGNVFGRRELRASVLNSLAISVWTSLLGAVIGLALAYGITKDAGPRLRPVLLALATIGANAGGLSLGFAFITILGRAGMLTLALKAIGLDLYSVFSLYSTAGLTAVYLYFQAPLMVVLMLPALMAIRGEWIEASNSLGGSSQQFWRRVGLPVLAPSIAGATILLFASSMGAYATAVALTGNRANLMTTQIVILQQGEVVFQPAQANALAAVLLAFVGVAVAAYNIAQRRALRWLT